MRRRKKKAGEESSQSEGFEPVIHDHDDMSDLMSAPISDEEPLDSSSWSGKYIEAAGSIDGWSTADQVLDLITSVQTVFPDFNRATQVGGLPVRRIHTVHGPTHGGKTAFVLGLVKSFVDVGYLGGYVDAEYSLGKEFAQEVVWELEKKPNFLAVRPENYEQTISKVDAFLFKAMKVKEKIPDSKAILVIDSINKLVPKRELEKLLKEGQINDKGAVELTKGHHGRYRAALNQAWLDQLTPKVSKSDTAVVIIAQERDDQDTTDFFNDKFKVKGGAALLFDASLVMRVMKGSPIWLNPSDDKKNENIAGFAHRVRIWKSKVGHMDGRYTDCAFHLSNGKVTLPGLDIARDAAIVGMKLGIIIQAGAWYSYRGRRTQGLNNFIKRLSERSAVLEDLLFDISKKLDKEAGRG